MLRYVRNLDFRSVEPQTLVRERSGRPRRIDFTISEPGVKVALEVDGYDKTGSGTGMTRAEFEDWSRREQEIVSQGWRLLRFANSLVERDPNFCVRNIERTLELERALSSRANPQSEHWQRAMRDAQQRAAAAERRLAALLQQAPQTGPGDTPAGDVVIARDEARQERDAVIDIVVRAAEDVLPRAEAEAVGADERERVHASLALQQRRIDEALARAVRAEKENQGMKVMAGAFAVIAVAVAVIVIATGDGTGPPSPPCGDAISWEQARDHIGETATLSGRVVSATYRAQSAGKPTFLNVGRPFGDDSRLVIVVWGRNRSKFPSAPERAYDDEHIAVSGRVEEYQGVPQIEVNTPSAIEAC